jgi:hypothetical protein
VPSVEDKPRLLARRSEYGYTDRAQSALPAEPEAVPADYQRHLTAQAHRRAENLVRREWQRTLVTINDALDRFASTCSPAEPRIASGLRAIRRSAQALDRRIGV